jgi:hypothetical protein
LHKGGQIYGRTRPAGNDEASPKRFFAQKFAFKASTILLHSAAERPQRGQFPRPWRG